MYTPTNGPIIATGVNVSMGQAAAASLIAASSNAVTSIINVEHKSSVGLWTPLYTPIVYLNLVR